MKRSFILLIKNDCLANLFFAECLYNTKCKLQWNFNEDFSVEASLECIFYHEQVN